MKKDGRKDKWNRRQLEISDEMVRRERESEKRVEK